MTDEENIDRGLRIESQIISKDNAKSNKIESQNNTESKKQDFINQDFIKLDSNDDEIIWELNKSNSIGARFERILYYIVNIAMLWFVIYIMFPLVLPLDNSFGKFLAIIVCILSIVLDLKNIFIALNYKGLCVTKDKLIIKHYLTKNITLPLGKFYTYSKIKVLGILSLFGDIVYFEGLEIQTGIFSIPDMLIDMEHYPFFHKIYELMKPHLIEYMLSLDDEEYIKARKPLKNIEKLT
ncbi:hypothetical protein CCZ01_07035, partial [Helicobacter monodelphidis]|uniref:hypothetical protein n=1 Tax=Helicobacter sp. 15-1451 TaxID=2004995 RepID=UPI000DCD31A4